MLSNHLLILLKHFVKSTNDLLIPINDLRKSVCDFFLSIKKLISINGFIFLNHLLIPTFSLLKKNSLYESSISKPKPKMWIEQSEAAIIMLQSNNCNLM